MEEVVREIYDCWGRGDFRTPQERFADDVVFVVHPSVVDPGEWRGHEGLDEYTRDFLAAWENLRIAAERVEKVGNRLLVKVHQTGRGRSSGVPVDQHYFQVWTMRGGRVVRLDVTADERQARALSRSP